MILKGDACVNTPIVNLIWFGLLLGIFYFVLIRPQQKAMKEHQKLISGLRKGDKVITQGGIYATVIVIDQDVVTVQVDKNVEVKLDKNSIDRYQG